MFDSEGHALSSKQVDLCPTHGTLALEAKAQRVAAKTEARKAKKAAALEAAKANAA